MRTAILIASFTLCAVNTAGAHDASARATYLGNAGVLVARGDAKILFDAFYADSYGQYALVPPALGDALLTDTPPYDGIDAIFVSHIHGDHFSPAPMIAYLRARQSVALYAPAQVRQAIVDAGVAAGDPILARIHAIDLEPEDRAKSFTVGDLAVDVVAIPHAGDLPAIQNYSWRVTLDDRTTVIHFGDAGAVAANFERHKDHFAARRHDAAFPPYWWYLDDAGRAVLETYIRAEKTIGVHVPANAAGNGAATRIELGGDAFTDPGEMREIGNK